MDPKEKVHVISKNSFDHFLEEFETYLDEFTPHIDKKKLDLITSSS